MPSDRQDDLAARCYDPYGGVPCDSCGVEGTTCDYAPDAATAPESDDPLVQCDGGDGWGCFIPHAHCVCQDEGTPTRRRASLLNRNPRPEDKWK